MEAKPRLLLIEASIKNTFCPGKSYFALLFNETPRRTAIVYFPDKHLPVSPPSSVHISQRPTICFPWPVRFNSISAPLNGEPVPLTHRKGVAIVVSSNHTGGMVNGDYTVAVCRLIRLDRENMLNFQITQCYIYKDDFEKLVSV